MSCAENKASQCQKIIGITQNVAQESQKNLQITNVKQVLQVADYFEKSSQEMDKTKIEDKELAKYKTGFVQVYLDYAKVTRSFVAAFHQRDLPTARLTKQQLTRISETEKQLVSEMNKYCQAGI